MAECDVAEAAGETDLGLVVEALIPEEPDAVLHQGTADGGHRVLAEVGAGVDALYLGSDPSGHGHDGELHGGLSGGRHVGSPLARAMVNLTIAPQRSGTRRTGARPGAG